jgi:hypothetical protein
MLKKKNWLKKMNTTHNNQLHIFLPYFYSKAINIFFFFWNISRSNIPWPSTGLRNIDSSKLKAPRTHVCLPSRHDNVVEIELETAVASWQFLTAPIVPLLFVQNFVWVAQFHLISSHHLFASYLNSFINHGLANWKHKKYDQMTQSQFCGLSMI